MFQNEQGDRGFEPKLTYPVSLSSLFQDLFSCRLWVCIAQSQVSEKTASKLPSLSVGDRGVLFRSVLEWQMLLLLGSLLLKASRI